MEWAFVERRHLLGKVLFLASICLFHYTFGKVSMIPNTNEKRNEIHLYQSTLLHLTELFFFSSGERTGRHPPHFGQLQHRQQQPMYPLLTGVNDLETHLCLYTYFSSWSKSLFVIMPSYLSRHCVSYPVSFRIEFVMFVQGSWWVCNQK